MSFSQDMKIAFHKATIQRILHKYQDGNWLTVLILLPETLRLEIIMDAQTIQAALAAALAKQSLAHYMWRSGGVGFQKDTKPAYFTLFPSLPIELRHMIWEFSLPPDEREIWLQEAPGNWLPLLPITFPIAMHVCREARAFARQRLQLNHSLAQPFETHCRGFRPDLDIYIYLCPRPRCPYPCLQRGQRPSMLRPARESMLSRGYNVAPILWRYHLVDLAKKLLPEWDDDAKATLWDDEQQTLKFSIKDTFKGECHGTARWTPGVGETYFLVPSSFLVQQHIVFIYFNTSRWT
ncbi:uncharacterized protein F4812DRAFT_455604 [Daldinia caldariorum]|uniref:uncharacterized protein n=1 Tax=Daldinia caldariorum TaxID=326644 RepID=UPI0020086DA5|nr:uncharacterized protein F4812DRAFT_455604 [Daldinia caldariorum]KAI1471489.1 hypothetical protein F4812DRAFT_455604 [Daldinia caldariorum]